MRNHLPRSLASKWFPLLLLVTAVAGCQSNPSPNAFHASPTDRAVISTGSHGGPIAVFMRGPRADQPLVLTTSGAAPRQICEGCRTAAATYFDTGVLPERCPVCGNTLNAAIKSH